MAGEGNGDMAAAAGFGPRDRDRLRHRSVRLHGVPEERVDDWIEIAEAVTAEAGAEFQRQVEASFLELIIKLEEECGRVFLLTEVEERIRQEIEAIHARFDDPGPEVDRLTRHVIEIEERGLDWEDR